MNLGEEPRRQIAAQTTEQDKFQELLRDLCAGIQEPITQRRGRPSLPLRDAVFAAAFKVYSGLAGRKFICDLRESFKRNFISRVPHYNSIFNYFENEDLTPVLIELIRQSSLPLAAVELDFAVVPWAFRTTRYTRWLDHRYGRVREEAQWVTARLLWGVKTSIVTTVEIGHERFCYSPARSRLVDETAESTPTLLNLNLGDVLRSKTHTAMANEALCKILCHNLVVLIYEIHALGIEPRFWN